MMRQSLLLAAAAAAALGLATGAAAQTADESGALNPSVNTQALRLEGVAPVACAIQLIALSPGSAATLASASQGNALVQLGSPNFVDPTTAVPTGGQVLLSVPVACNGAHTLRVRSGNGKLTLEGGGQGGNGFRNAVDYDLTTSWAGSSQGFSTTAGSDLQIPVSEAAAGEALVTINIPAGGQPLVAGTYSDQIIVEVVVGS